MEKGFFKKEARKIHEKSLLQSTFSHFEFYIEVSVGLPIVDLKIIKVDKNGAKKNFNYTEDHLIINERLQPYFSFIESFESSLGQYSIEKESLEIIINSLYRFVKVYISYSFGEKIPVRFYRNIFLNIFESEKYFELQIENKDTGDIFSLSEKNTLPLQHGLFIRGSFFFLEEKHLALINIFIEENNKYNIVEEKREDFLVRIMYLFPKAYFDKKKTLRKKYKQTKPYPSLEINDNEDFYKFNLLFNYESIKFSIQDERIIFNENFFRSLVEESKIVKELLDLKFYYQKKENFFTINKAHFADALKTLLQKNWLIKFNDIIISERKEINVSLEDNVNEESFSIKDKFLKFSNKGPFFSFDDSDELFVLTEEQKILLKFLKNFSKKEGENLTINKKIWSLNNYLFKESSYIKIRENFKSTKNRSIEKIGKIKNLNATLREYQVDGVSWLKNNRSFKINSCLADDMGLGKTVQVIALLTYFKNNGELKKPCLIIVPKSLIFNWLKEFKKFSPKISILDYSKADRANDYEKSFDNYEVVLTTYNIAVRDSHKLSLIHFFYLILDEGQLIKNSKTLRYQSFIKFKAENKVILTGTPVENNIEELYNLMRFLNPDLTEKTGIIDRIKSFSQKEDDSGFIKKVLSPFILRRKKTQVVKELPKLIEETIYCSMDKKQKKYYDDMYRTYIKLIKQNNNNYNILNAINVLRQICCHPNTIENNNIPSAKFDFLIPYLKDIVNKGQKTIVFSNFTKVLAIFKKELKAENLSYAYLDGKTKDREKAVYQFQKENKQIFLISIKAGGLGLNLTKADYIFILDPWWNKSVEDQAVSRAHRIGREEKVICYKLICRETLEEKILELQNKKQALTKSILDDQENIKEKVNNLQYLLS